MVYRRNKVFLFAYDKNREEWVKEKSVVRTDLALELHGRLEKKGSKLHGICVQKEEIANGMEVTNVTIETENAAKSMGKPKGQYITIEFGKFIERNYQEQMIEILIEKIKSLLPPIYEKEESELSVLVVGLGNKRMEADSLGPRTIEKIIMSRHIRKEFGKYAFSSEDVSSISGIATGVLTDTGMEAREIISGIVKETMPDVVIVIDALAGKSTKRIGKTIQLTDTGVVPGSGVGIHRKAINEENIGVPVLLLGIPTLVDTGDGFYLIPKNLSEILEILSSILAKAINRLFTGNGIT